MINPRVMGTALAFLLGAACFAQETYKPFPETDLLAIVNDDQAETHATYGVQVYFARPQLDLRAMVPRTGQGAGLFMEERLTPTTVLQTRIDYVSYRQVNFPVATDLPLVATGITALSTNAFALGADLRMYLPYEALKKVYILGGMSAIRYEFRAMATPIPTLDQNGVPLPTAPAQIKTATALKWGLALGLGWEFRPGYALTARYTYTPIATSNLGALEFGIRASF